MQEAAPLPGEKRLLTVWLDGGGDEDKSESPMAFKCSWCAVGMGLLPASQQLAVTTLASMEGVLKREFARESVCSAECGFAMVQQRLRSDMANEIRQRIERNIGRSLRQEEAVPMYAREGQVFVVVNEEAPTPQRHHAQKSRLT